MHEQHQSSQSPPLWLVCAAFATVYVVWGSTYLGIRFAVETIPPFLMAGVRFFVAGVILVAFMKPRYPQPLERKQWLAAAVIGTLMLLGGNGLVCWAEQYVASGIAALLVATVPSWMVVLNWWFCGGQRPGARTIAGLLGGMVGIYLLVGPSDIKGQTVDFAGSMVLLLACIFWSWGSLYARTAPLPKSAVLASGMEMLTAGIVLILVGLILGEWSRFDVQAVTTKSWLALGYLIVFGSLLALTAYRWLLQVCTPARVSTYAYVNPIIAVLLGTLLANEPLSPRLLVAAAIIIASVVLISMGTKK